MALCHDEGIKLGPRLICRFDADGIGVNQAMGASEIADFMRMTLQVPPQPRNVLRSHSCKATVLSWLAKFGAPLHLRRIVGHHLDPAAKSAETFSRDAMSQGLRVVCEVVGVINAGRFPPDCTQSGRFAVPRQEKASEPDALTSLLSAMHWLVIQMELQLTLHQTPSCRRRHRLTMQRHFGS